MGVGLCPLCVAVFPPLLLLLLFPFLGCFFSLINHFYFILLIYFLIIKIIALIPNKRGYLKLN